MGGYTIVNLHDVNFTIGTGQKIPGIYDKIEGTRKPILLTGITVGGIERMDRYTCFGLEGTTYVSDATISYATDIVRVEIQQDDTVTFTRE